MSGMLYLDIYALILLVVAVGWEYRDRLIIGISFWSVNKERVTAQWPGPVPTYPFKKSWHGPLCLMAGCFCILFHLFISFSILLSCYELQHFKQKYDLPEFVPWNLKSLWKTKESLIWISMPISWWSEQKCIAVSHMKMKGTAVQQKLQTLFALTSTSKKLSLAVQTKTLTIRSRTIFSHNSCSNFARSGSFRSNNETKN